MPVKRRGGAFVLADLKTWARSLKRDIHAIYFAARDPRVPWYAKALALIVAGYALSPIDLIPDFIPVLGYLDDLVLVPIGIWLVVALIPSDVMVQCRALAIEAGQRPVSRAGAIAIASIWLVSAAAMIWVFLALGGEPKQTDPRPA
jgi:uncharacterized membrane protein YkvA (DUF1232 family)